MKKLTQLLLLFCALAFSATTMAQNTTGEIKGRVFDSKTGEALEFVDVYVQLDATRTVSYLTDEEGRFTLKPLEPGSYTVKFHIVGYSKLDVTNVTVKPDQITRMMETKITAGILIGGGEIPEIVEYTNPLIIPGEASKMVVLAADIKNNPSLRSPALLLQHVAPGVSNGGSSDGQLYFRGSRSGASGYYVDGVKSISGMMNIPSAAIGSISVYTGGIPAKYGDATGGIVAIETQSYFNLLREHRIKQAQ